MFIVVTPVGCSIDKRPGQSLTPHPGRAEACRGRDRGQRRGQKSVQRLVYDGIHPGNHHHDIREAEVVLPLDQPPEVGEPDIEDTFGFEPDEERRPLLFACQSRVNGAFGDNAEAVCLGAMSASPGNAVFETRSNSSRARTAGDNAANGARRGDERGVFRAIGEFRMTARLCVLPHSNGTASRTPILTRRPKSSCASAVKAS